MKLTQEQILKIENYLDVKELTYVDIRLEVLDHMISDIENIITTENLIFKDAFNKSIQKWNPQLRLNSSWVTGLVYHRPEIVIQKSRKIFIKWYALLMTIMLITIFVSTNDTIAIIKKNIYFDFNLMTISFLMMSNILVGYWYIKILKSKIKSSYLFLFEKQVFYTSLFTSVIVLIDFVRGGEISSSFTLIYIPLIPISTVLGFILFKKHQEIIKRFMLVK